MNTPIMSDLGEMQAERAGYMSNPKPATSNNGFMPLDQLLSNLPPTIEYQPEPVAAPQITPDEIKIQELKTFIGGLDHLNFNQPVIQPVQEIEVKKVEVKVAEPIEEAPAKAPFLGEINFKQVIKDTVKEQTTTARKKVWKESKDVYKALFGLVKDYVLFKKPREKTAKEKEAEKKNAERQANKRAFFDRLRSSLAEFQNEKFKKRMENRKRLNIAGLAPEQVNQFLGEKRNTSFEDVDSDYYDEQTAWGMFYKREAEKKAKAQQAVKAAGGSLTDQFGQARFAGERGAGHNAQSATG